MGVCGGDTCETFSQFGVIGITGTYLKEDSLGIAQTITRKDNIGRLTEKSYINRNKSLVADKSGIAKYIYEYADTWTWETKTIHCFDIHDKEIKDIPEFIKQRAAEQTQEASSEKDKWQNTTGYEKTNLSIHNGDIVDNSDNSTNSHIESNNTTNLILNWNLIFEFTLISLAVNLSVAITIFFFKKKKKIINRIKKLFIH
ncbi:hypothetical protein AGMMS50262_21160 [Bacteroidia bacterium]|nr:hypothetical protein AGMMS50262_21160 [Bacteroidia bacterium]